MQQYQTLTGMKQALNLMNVQNAPHVPHSYNPSVRQSNDRRPRDSIVIQSRHPNRQSQQQKTHQVLVIPQSAVLTAHQQLINQQMQARSNQNSAIARLPPRD